MDSEKVIRIIDELIFEAQKAPTWKAENALRCLKKDLLKEQEAKEQISDAIHETAKQFRRQIVMCKDCKHGEPCNEGDVYCTKDIGTFESSVHKPQWFCADGERREAE